MGEALDVSSASGGFFLKADKEAVQRVLLNEADDTAKIVLKNGETSATIRGKEAHKNYGDALGADYDTRVILPSGKKPDAVNWNTNEVRELKPDNPRAVKGGEKQVENYRQELEKMTGEPWSSAVDTYKK